MENNLNAQQLTLVADFISSMNNLINGKFILADVKIAEVLKKIEDSEALFRFVSESLINFSFEKELRKAEIKNRFNGGVFKLPNESHLIVALVFCLLVEFDAKRIDFYDFIKENFPTLDNKGDQKAFSETILVPFRDIIARFFGLSKEDNEALIKELKAEIVKEQQEEERQQEILEVEKTREDTLFENITQIEQNILQIVEDDIKIKEGVREDLIFILKAMIYSNKYQDLKIVNALLVSFESMSHKIASIKFVYSELKQILLDYYRESMEN
ncbi:MAG: hypothetical protein AB7S44_02420 [Spirochaetales bacterium]